MPKRALSHCPLTGMETCKLAACSSGGGRPEPVKAGRRGEDGCGDGGAARSSSVRTWARRPSAVAGSKCAPIAASMVASRASPSRTSGEASSERRNPGFESSRASSNRRLPGDFNTSAATPAMRCDCRSAAKRVNCCSPPTRKNAIVAMFESASASKIAPAISSQSGSAKRLMRRWARRRRYSRRPTPS